MNQTPVKAVKPFGQNKQTYETCKQVVAFSIIDLQFHFYDWENCIKKTAGWCCSDGNDGSALIASVVWHYSMYGIQEYLDSFLGGHLVGSNKC